ncbi:hypothetical protein HNV11_06935 [Spirosoma taeanense]|uniref:Uncharacterized protein n=1 Tax=Spirosoma taeanense TaxID=2735870 RepID=A0A6M5Y6P5_9BACT|nr:hypothetical protein [Spirosoma taeanense]QJW89144.1 hypothetical protein HNV11_06935 [Spirosoma taeanense]
MSWKFGGIYLKHDFGCDPVLALNRLDINKRFTYERVRFSDTVAHFFEPTAIGIIGDVTLVHNRPLAYDHSYNADTYTNADHRLLVLSREIECVVFYLDGSTDSYGLAHFRDGRRVGHFSQLGGEVVVQEGDFDRKDSTAEAAMFDRLEQFTGISFNQLMLDEKPIMYVFTETGF